MYKTVINRKSFLAFIALFFLSFSAYSATLNLTTKYGKTGGLRGNLNAVGNTVNGNNICTQVNTNANLVAGCDMSDDPGYVAGANTPTDDSYTGDLVVRTNDNFELVAAWSWLGNVGEDQVTLSSTLPAGTNYIFDGIPGACDQVLSTLSADGKTINCIRSNFDTNDVGSYAEDLTFAVRVVGDAINGDQPGALSLTLSDPDASVPSTPVTDDTEGTSLVVTAAPRWNIEKNAYTVQAGRQDDLGNPGWYIWYNFLIEVDEVSGATDSPINPSLGNEALSGGPNATVTFTDDLSGISPNAKLVTWDTTYTTFSPQANACDMDSNYSNSDEPYTVYNAANPDRSIQVAAGDMNVTCVQTGSSVAVTVTGIDSTLTNAPTSNRNGGLLPVNRNIAAVGVIRVFVPLSDVVDNGGSIATNNCLTDFDPAGISGGSNFGSGYESELDNCHPTTLNASAGSWDKNYRKGWSDRAAEQTKWGGGGWSLPPTDGSIVEGGDGIVTPGGVWGTYTHHSNTGGTPFTNVTLCDVIDVETFEMTIIDPTDVYGTAGSGVFDLTEHAVDLLYSNTESNAGLTIEYATGYVGTWPPDPTVAPSSGATDEVVDECSDSTITWYPTLAAAETAGGAPVSKVRISVPSQEPGLVMAMRIKHTARSTYLTSGLTIPNDTLLINHATYTRDGLTGTTGDDGRNWRAGDYIPFDVSQAPDNGGGGDRLTMVRAKARIIKDMAPGAVSPGTEVTVTLSPSFTVDGPSPETGTVVIADLLPIGMDYIYGSTAGTYGAGATPYGEPLVIHPLTDADCNAYVPDVVAEGFSCGDTLNGGATEKSILVWDLGTQTTGLALGDIVFNGIVTVDAPAPVTLENYVQISSSADSSPSSQRVANANVSNTVPASLLIVKSVLTPLHEINSTSAANNWMNFQIGLRNGSTAVAATDLDFIDILPFNGDGALGSFTFTPSPGTTVDRSRSPASYFSGTLEFGSASFDDNGGACDITTLEYWYTGDTSPLDVSPKNIAKNAIPGGSSNWCEGNAAGPNSCNGLTNADVTAFRVIGPTVPETATCFVNITYATAGANEDKDIYSNTAGAEAVGISNAVLSNTVSAEVFASSIGNYVWHDINGDGVQDASELAIPGVTVRLLDGSGNPVNDLVTGQPYEVVTNANGRYLFENLVAGDYQVEFVLPTGMGPTDKDAGGDDALDSDINTTGITDTITLGLDENNRDVDAGIVGNLTLGDFVWHDLDADGIQDPGEAGVPGTTVNLLYADGTSVLDADGNPLSVLTDSNGGYIFTDLLPGDYIVEFVPPTGYNITLQDQAGDGVNSDADPVTGRTAVINLTENLDTVDAGLHRDASLGDRVWLDLDSDGIQDANEDGISGVTVNLYEDTDGDGVISGAEATTPVATVVTGPDGEYLFPDLTPGVVYQTAVDESTVTAGLDQTYDEGAGGLDHTSDPITLESGEFHRTADFGYGPPGGAIGDTIWVDSNGDGVQDPGELGIGDVVVNLTYIDDMGNEVVLTAITAPDGTYLFTDLPLDTAYKVEVDITTLPDGYASAPNGSGDPDVRDGNSTVADNTTYITLTADEPVNLEADFGYLPPAGQDNSVGDTIYLDTDGDGTQAADGTEPGIAGVTVALYDDMGSLLAVTITDANGNYEFTGLPDGDYDIVVTDATGELSDYTQTGDPDGSFDNTSTVSLDPTSIDDAAVVDLGQDFGYQPAAALGSGVIGDTIFLDANSDGVPGEGEGISGVTVNLYDDTGKLLATTVTDDNGNYSFTGLETSPGGVSYEVRVDTSTLPAGLTNSVDPDTMGVGDSVSTVTLTDAAPENLDQDFGYTSEDDNTISGTVWTDTDGNGEQDEAGSFAGVTIELRDEDGNVIQSTTTDVDGNYEFTNLPDGVYAVVVTDEDGVLDSATHTDSPNGSTDTSNATSKDDQGYVVDLDSGGLDDNPVTDETGDFGYTPVITNPITLGSFSASSVTGGVQLDWATQAEVSNLGFNVYASVNDAWVKLNESLILSQGDSTSIQSYSFIAAVEAGVFALGDIDVAGVETVHGPFMLGDSYGEIGERQMIDWAADKAERDAKQAERDAQRLEQQEQRNEERRLRRLQQSEAPTSYLNEELIMPTNDSRSWLSRATAIVVAALIPTAHAQGEYVEDLVNLNTTQAGIHQVTFDDVGAYGIDLTGTPVNELAVINQGVPVQISVVDVNDNGVFETGDAIRFIAHQVDTLYSDTNVYTLRLDTQAHSLVSEDDSLIPSGAAAVAYLAKASFAPQSSYSFASPDQDDPWYATSIVASNGAASETMTLALDNVAPGGNSGSTKAKLRVNVWGATALAGSADDHHIKVNFNNTEVTSSRFDGLAQEQLNVELNNVQAGNNSVKLTLPLDTGYEFDKVNVDEVEVSYPRQFVAIDDRLDFPSTFRKFTLSGFTSNEVVVMREDSEGVSSQSEVNAACRSTCSVQFGGTGQLAQYYVSTADALYSPSLDALPLEQDITSNNAVYLIISHPDFVGASSLQNLQADLVSEMGSAQIVDVDAIYAQFGHHLFGPEAIQAYIQYAHANLGTQYVLLVGGDVYDYRQFENEDATSFIPSIYASTGNSINFAPVDAKYVDLDDDNVPDLPIGRLPVRTVAELDSLLNKRTDYLARTYQGKVLLVADEYDVAQQYDFASDADEIDADFLSNFSVTKAYVDTVGVQAARASVVNQLNAGQSLTAFFGHSSTNQWAFNGLFTGNDAAGLTNYDKPTVVTQWGCWNAYYVSPNEDSMGHRFMMEGDQGAVAVMGASTLTNANSERKLARLVLARIANGERLGDAIMNAKQEYAIDSPNDLDVLLGWTLLGLPDLVVN